MIPISRVATIDWLQDSRKPRTRVEKNNCFCLEITPKKETPSTWIIHVFQANSKPNQQRYNMLKGIRKDLDVSLNMPFFQCAINQESRPASLLGCFKPSMLRFKTSRAVLVLCLHQLLLFLTQSPSRKWWNDKNVYKYVLCILIS